MIAIEKRLNQYMSDWAAANRFCGTALIAQGDRLLLKKGYGYANVEHRVPHAEDTIFCIASITKQFTAAAVLQQVEQGKLRLEDRLESFLPEYKHSASVTLHQLLSSTSGVPDYTEVIEYSTRAHLSVETIIEWLNRRPLDFEPGQGVQKSNTNFVFLAKVVEKVTGLSLEEYFTEYLFKPAGLLHTGIYQNEDVIPNRAYGYSYSGEGIVQAEYYDMSGAYGSGFLYSTAEDLFRWGRALASEASILSINSYRAMITPYGYLPYLGVSMGYGCSVSGDPVDVVSVNGNIFGFTCSVHRYLEGDYSVILLSNNDAVPLGRINEGIKSILFHLEPEVVIRPHPLLEVDYSSFAHLAGEYGFAPMGWRFAVSFEEGKLYLDRLFLQEAKRKKFQIHLVSDEPDRTVFSCEVCDTTVSFLKTTNQDDQSVLYRWDTLQIPYQRVSHPS